MASAEMLPAAEQQPKREKIVKKPKERYLDIRRRSAELVRLYGGRVKHKDVEERVIRRLAGLVVSECLWLCELVDKGVDLKGADITKFGEIKSFFTELALDNPDEVKRNLFIPSVPARLVPDMAWLVSVIEAAGARPVNPPDPELPPEDNTPDEDE
jgi:hypothetical protein